MKPTAIFLTGVLMLLHSLAAAVTLRVATASDVQSLDPQSGDAAQLAFAANIYEPLIGRDRNMGLVPVLAMAWSRTAPTVWRFHLRRGVKFHDGRPFTADDVLFTLERANSEGSEIKGTWFKAARRIDDATVEIETLAPYPLLPDSISTYLIMSRKWCMENGALKPADRRKGSENRAGFLADGTGAFRLKERQPSLRTVLERNPNYWGKVEGNLDEIVSTPIGNDATRVAALLSGAVDLIEPAPLQDIDRIRSFGRFTVLQGPELRTIYIGMDVKRDQLLFSNVKGRNPFKDRRVRQAVYQAIDVETIKTQVMRNAAVLTALMVAPGVRGFQPDMNVRLPYDPQTARKLLVEAGYPNGFEVGMNCPNDRYVNDAAICQAVAAQLARIGITLDLHIEPKSLYLPKVLRHEVSMYLLGWTPSTLDAQELIAAAMATPDGTFQGRANGGSYSNPAIDALTLRIQRELDEKQRNEMIREAFRIHQDDIGHIPLHQQALAWAFSNRVSVVQMPDNAMHFMWFSLGSR